jgi:two-component system nitrate/nitrite sensor histidine kinase NarX
MWSATHSGIVLVRDFRQLNQQRRYRCQEEGFFSLAVFQILAREQVIGSFFALCNERVISGEERRLLETLGKNLGSAIENQRLIARKRICSIAGTQSAGARFA